MHRANDNHLKFHEINCRFQVNLTSDWSISDAQTFFHHNCRFWKSASLIGANNDAFSSRLTLEQDFNRENHMAQIHYN